MFAIIRRYRPIPTDARFELDGQRLRAKSEKEYLIDMWAKRNAEHRKLYPRRRRKNQLGWPFNRAEMVSAVTAIDSLAEFMAGSNVAPMKKRAAK